MLLGSSGTWLALLFLLHLILFLSVLSVGSSLSPSATHSVGASMSFSLSFFLHPGSAFCLSLGAQGPVQAAWPWLVLWQLPALVMLVFYCRSVPATIADVKWCRGITLKQSCPRFSTVFLWALLYPLYTCLCTVLPCRRTSLRNPCLRTSF